MKIVIVGAGAVGTHLSKLLSREHQDCVLIDDDDEKLSILNEYDVMTYNASPTSIKAMKEAGVQHADLFVGVTPEETTNLTACMIAHQLGAKKTVARIDNYEYLAPQNKEIFKAMGSVLLPFSSFRHRHLWVCPFGRDGRGCCTAPFRKHSRWRYE